MDQMVIDLGGREVSSGGTSLLGAEAELFGNGADGGPTADDWARAAGTNNYEIVTRISPRVPRHYINESETPPMPAKVTLWEAWCAQVPS
jgi:alanine racemase